MFSVGREVTISRLRRPAEEIWDWINVSRFRTFAASVYGYRMSPV
jgi:hypothetical protein